MRKRLWLRTRAEVRKTTVATATLGEHRDGFALSAMATGYSDLALLKWLHMHGYNCFLQPVDDELADTFYGDLAMQGGLDVLQWLHSLGVEMYPPYLAINAASGGHRDVLEWLDELGHTCTDYDTCLMAADNGHLPVLKWLAEHGAEVVTQDLAESAASGEHLDVLEWMLEEGLDLNGDDWLCKTAARNGHLTVLQLLRTHGCPIAVAACMAEVEKSIRRRRGGRRRTTRQRAVWKCGTGCVRLDERGVPHRLRTPARKTFFAVYCCVLCSRASTQPNEPARKTDTDPAAPALLAALFLMHCWW
jgi:hypothetical protein